MKGTVSLILNWVILMFLLSKTAGDFHRIFSDLVLCPSKKNSEAS